MDLGDQLLPPRSVEDILAERVRLVIDGQQYVLPVPRIPACEAWKAQLDVTMSALLSDAQEEDPGRLLDSLAADSDPFVDLLISFDEGGILPDREGIRSGLTPLGLLVNVLEVWRAVNPLVDIGLDVWTTTVQRASGRRRPMSALPPSTAGPQPVSVPN